MSDLGALQSQLTAHQQEVSRNFNELNRVVGGLVATVTNLTNTWMQQDRAATEGRRLLHDKIDEAVTSINTLTNRLTILEDKMEDVQPAVDAFNHEKLRSEGAKKLGGRLWLGVCSVCGVMGYGISQLLAWWKH